MPDSLGDRMKQYENAYRVYLPKRLPVIVRIDGRAFHTLTRGFRRPFDSVLSETMSTTTLALCEAVEGVKMAYTQSDEISLLITNNDTIDTEPWFNNNLQKLTSLTASIATLAFNKNFHFCVAKWLTNDDPSIDEEAKYVPIYNRSSLEAMFDSRTFILPPDEVTNYFIWRQQDATRNSINMVAQSLYSHKELHGKNCNEMQDMIHAKGQKWNDYPTVYKRGLCYVKKPTEYVRMKWVEDRDIPIFTENRKYIESRFIVNE